MPIGDVFGILQFTPLAITAGAALFLGARVGWRRWSATCIGLLGVLSSCGLEATRSRPMRSWRSHRSCSPSRAICSRAASAGVPSLVIAGASAAIVTLASLGFTLFETWELARARRPSILLGASLALLAGQYWLIAAMRTGEIAVVAPFRYSIILWAVLSGYLVWHERPISPSWVGIAIVSAAGLYTFVREQRLARAAQT